MDISHPLGYAQSSVKLGIIFQDEHKKCLTPSHEYHMGNFSNFFHANLDQKPRQQNPLKSINSKVVGKRNLFHKSPSCVEFLRGCWHPRIRGCFHPPRPLASPSFNQLWCLCPQMVSSRILVGENHAENHPTTCT